MDHPSVQDEQTSFERKAQEPSKPDENKIIDKTEVNSKLIEENENKIAINEKVTDVHKHVKISNMEGEDQQNPENTLENHSLNNR